MQKRAVKKIKRKLSEFENEEVETSDYGRTTQQTVFLNRRLRLIIRDPLAYQLIKEFGKLEPPIDEYPDEVLCLIKRLEEKWHIRIMSTKDQKYRYTLSGKPYHDFIDPEGKYSLVIYSDNSSPILKPISYHYLEGESIEKYPWKEPCDIEMIPGHEKLLLAIDLNLLNLNDAKEVKRKVWQCIAGYINKRKKEMRRAKIFNEPDYLLFLYSCRGRTLDNYLSWYDLHMGKDYETPKGFNFRQIAFLKYAEKQKPGQIEEAKEGILTKGGVIGFPIHGEDAVAYGVKVVYKAIHRQPYPSKKKQDLFNCPMHGEICPEDCKNLQQSMKIFNNRYKLRPLFTTDNIDDLEDIKGIKKPAKGKAQKIIGLQKKQDEEGSKYFPKPP